VAKRGPRSADPFIINSLAMIGWNGSKQEQEELDLGNSTAHSYNIDLTLSNNITKWKNV